MREIYEIVNQNRASLLVKLMAKVVKCDDDSCWLWTGTVESKGYGQIQLGSNNDRITLLTHRLSYCLYVGDPSDLFVMHKCDIRRCVNPNHLFLGTHADNMADMVANGRGANLNTNKTHCKHGHEFNAENTYFWTDGTRRCRACGRLRDKVRYKTRARHRRTEQ